MKLRIKGNSLRLRLSRPEVNQVAAEGRLENQTDFGAGVLRFVFAASKEAAALSARFEEGSILVVAPIAQVAAWAANEDVGLYGEQSVSETDVLSIAVEKDFRCLDRSRAEDDEADNYPHPALKPKAS